MVVEHLQINSTQMASNTNDQTPWSQRKGRWTIAEPDNHDHWQNISSGNALALTVHDGMLYITAYEDSLYLLDKGIFSQPLNRITPYSNWTLIGWGAMTSIAIHASEQGKMMYGVGTRSWLYRQKLATMRDNNVWELVSVFPVSSISISGDTIYGISPTHASQVYKLDCRIFGQPNGQFHGWFPVTTGPIKSLSIFGDSIFAIMENNKIYNKSLTLHLAHASANTGANDTELVTFEDFWSLRNNANMLSIAVVGDTIYGVSPSHKVCRAPVVVHEKWAPIASGRMQSLAINANGDTIYAAGEDGNVYKQDLLTMGPGTEWLQVASPDVSSIAIQGGTIYGVGSDKTLYKQRVDSLSDGVSWERASACCVLQVSIADGIVYAVGEDLKVYSQNDILMTPTTQWVLVANGPWKFITTREDSMYGVDPEGVTHIQSLSYLTPYKKWTRTSIEDEDQNYPAKAYTCLTAHNDVMYACGPDMVVYSKLIDRHISYPPRLQARGDTYQQAMDWNLTGLHKARLETAGIETTPVFRETTTLSREDSPLNDQPSTSKVLVYQDGKEPGSSQRYIDTYRDKDASAVYGGGMREAPVKALSMIVSSLALLLRSS